MAINDVLTDEDCKDAQPTGRRRCTIPEHRKQIKLFQRHMAWQRAVNEQSWTRQRLIQKEHELTQRKMYRLWHAVNALRKTWWWAWVPVSLRDPIEEAMLDVRQP